MSWGHTRWRVRCFNCGWRGIRTSITCECYEDWAPYCRPGSPGPGCPSGVVWPCPRCGRSEPNERASDGLTPNKFGSFVRAVAEVAPRMPKPSPPTEGAQ